MNTPLAIKLGLQILLAIWLLGSGRAIADSASLVALVIGNQQYAHLPLATPEADASAMTRKLEAAGYTVTKVLNARRNDLYDVIDDFFARNREARAIVFFYAGHGVQLNGRNFLVPVDLPGTDDPDILSRMFDLRYLLNKLTEAKAETRLVILDACRDNVFSSHPNAASGLSELIAPSGTFVAFSTAPGSTAEDGEGENSPYTTALLDSLFRPGIKVEEAFKDVRRKVRLMTNNTQTPWESTSLVSDYSVTQTQPAGKKSKSSAADEKAAKNSPPKANPSSGTKDAGLCARILTKMSIGMMALSSAETEALANCRQ